MTTPDPRSDDEQLASLDPTLPDDEFLEAFKAALQADENEAVYGWMAEESEGEQRE